MKYNWTTLPKRLSLFTKRNTGMVDLQTGKIIQYYSANTKIALAQSCETETGTYYRTESATRSGKDWAFRADAFGLPNSKSVAPIKKAPSAPSVKQSSLKKLTTKTQVNRTPAKKQTPAQKVTLPKDGEGAKPRKRGLSKLLSRLFKK